MGRSAASVAAAAAAMAAVFMLSDAVHGAEHSKSHAENSKFVVPAVDFNDDGATFMKGMASALAENGIIAVRNVPGLSKLRHEAFKSIISVASSNSEYLGCSGLSMDDEEIALKIKLQDETARTTFAAPVKPEQAVASVSRRLELVRGAESGSCASDASKKVEELRSLLDQAASKFAQGLDSEILIRNKQGLFESVDEKQNQGYQTFSELVEKGDHLDHLHIYEKIAPVNNEYGRTLDFHTDQGLFIAIIPALEFNLGKDGSIVEKKNGDAIFEILVAGEDGEEVAKEIVLPDGGDVVLFMIGDGSEFMKREAHKMLKPVPHALTMIASAHSARVWMGRMFFPPTDAAVVHPETGETTTFDGIKKAWKHESQEEENYESPNGYHGLGCSSTPFKKGDLSLPFNYRRRVLAGTSCKSNEIYCWHTCASISGLSCSSSQIKCMDLDTNLPWDGVAHCNCEPKCVSTSSPVVPSSTPATPKPTSKKPKKKKKGLRL